ncbi:MAG: hypothetical protein CMI09_15110 [Oceanospirillaceae bacterium]|nr:hypothetical protein [Oceanospirillaceae bacterium]|tara:strand:- start:1634 stop:2206 length:573 start_codon:yes stop_codon:yes gene_type:complete
MKFTPELTFEGGRVRPLEPEDRDALFGLFQHPELPGQRPVQQPEQLDRMIELSVQMAATQRGMMWALEVGEPDNYQLLGMVSGYEWQPSLLRVMFRVDGLPELSMQHRFDALQVCMSFMAEKYHLFNFGYQWIEGQNPEIISMLESSGFQQAARLRDAWRTGESSFADVVQFHHLKADEHRQNQPQESAQ